MGRSTVHYADNETNNILKRLHNKLRPAGTPVERVEYIIELLLLRIFEAKLKQDGTFTPLRKLFEGENYRLLFSHLLSLTGDQVLSELNKNIFPFYASILTKARHVISGNMPTKMQDQLVLMEEVFANSNFTNNVKGGVIAEVIGLVNEIEEQRVLKTDLLGDAIESALSETGGTKDLGLYRTPDHIRKMMVEMVDPDFTDTIFDPACGTSGFLFNAYEYVIEKARKTRRFPPEHIANQFYRAGIGGIEYQGRIRKMAAVNMYIRGLNPHNIAQGDSLKMYDPSSDAGSKSVVIANPPFGAERDQPAYPNVWEEYSKESETTILFVKLMFDLLKQGGRCAVVVSEGFLTWGQNSACALRKLLLNEANLRAIISLPQGVFVSKGGQGAKTSILYFEKGQPTAPSLQPAGTSFVWYYKIENDGFSMGTNRKPIEGSQIPQLLEIFKEIKQGKRPKDTRHSFCIPKEWIETLDPRLAERIKREVKERFTEKNKAKREKLLAGLDEKRAKGKLNKAMYDEKLWQFDNVVESQIDNEVAKAIEKANSYHFNLQNYRSNLSEEQIKEWQSVCHPTQIPHGHSEHIHFVQCKLREESQGSSIEKRYQELKTADTQTALQILASFEPQNALQMDIAREFLHKLPKEVLETNEVLKRLEEIVRKGFQYPLVPLRDLITPKYEKIKREEYKGDLDIVDKISFSDGKIHLREQRQTGMDLYLAEKRELITSKINLHQGAIALNDIGRLACSTHYQVYHVNHSEVRSEYLVLMMRSNRFLLQIANEKNKGIKNEAGYEFISRFSIPLPPLEIQREIVEKIEKQKAVISASDMIEGRWTLDFSIADRVEKLPIEEVTSLITDGTHKTPNYTDNGIIFLSAQNIKDLKLDFMNIKYISKEEYDIISKRACPKKNDVLLAKSGTLGVAALVENDIQFGIYESLALLRPIQEKVLPKYLFYALNSPYTTEAKNDASKGMGVKHLHLEDIKNIQIPLPPLPIQQEIVAKLDREMEALEGVRLLRQEAERRVERIIAEVWGGGCKA